MHLRYLILVIALLCCPSCAWTVSSNGQLGLSDSRRIVIVGENVRQDIALYYEKKYDALVWFTPFEGRMSKVANNLVQSGMGPSRAMRGLISELNSINYSVGRWEIIVPKIAEKYFLTALKNMASSSLSKARGAVVLIDSKGYTEMENELRRVSDGNFFVTYEFQKDI